MGDEYVYCSSPVGTSSFSLITSQLFDAVAFQLPARLDAMNHGTAREHPNRKLAGVEDVADSAKRNADWLSNLDPIASNHLRIRNDWCVRLN